MKKDDRGCDDNGGDVHDINLDDDDRKQVMMPDDDIKPTVNDDDTALPDGLNCVVQQW